MKRGTALVMLARASEDILVAQQEIEGLSDYLTNLEEDEAVPRDSLICDIRDRAAVLRLITEGTNT